MTKIANAMRTFKFNLIPYADLSLIQFAPYPLLAALLLFTTLPLPSFLLTIPPFYLLSVTMNPLPLYVPHASVGKTIPFLLPLHVTQPHHLPLHPFKHPLTNVINDPLTSPHSSQAPVIHYSPKTILNASLANNPKNSLTIKSALLPINLNAISPLIQKTTNSSPKVPHFAN